MKLKGIVLAVILLLASIMMPFDVYADTISNSNVNINYYLDSVTEVSNGSYLQTYKVDFIFDQSYLGWISTKLVGTYVSNNTLPTITSQFTITKAIYVNGSIASTTVSFTTPNTIANGALQSLSHSIQNSNVAQLADLSTLDDILNVLTDINNNIEIDVIGELQSIVANTSLANDYLEIISKIRNWNIPFESFPIVFGSLFSEPVNFQNYDYDMKFPIFDLSESVNLGRFYLNSSNVYTFIMMLPITSLGTFNNNFEFYNDRGYTTTITNFVANSRTTLQSFTNGLCLIKFNIQSSNNGFYFLRNKSNMTGYYMPIYWNLSADKNISTDFALLFGLSNSLLDNLNIIAQGTQQSNSASSDLESSNSQMADDMDDLATIESGYNQQFNNQLQSIDFTSPIQSNAGILPAANFVITIFNGLINNNPFSVLIIIVCILLIGKKVIGK